MMTTQSLFQAWRKPSAPGRLPRHKRHWHLDAHLPRAGAPAQVDEGDEAGDSNWFESSRALAMGLQVTEIADGHDAWMRLAAAPPACASLG